MNWDFACPTKNQTNNNNNNNNNKQFCEHFLKINYYSNDIHHISLTIRNDRFATDGW